MPKPERFGRMYEDIMRSALSDRAKVVYTALSMFAGTDGECWPGEEQLAEVTHRSTRRVRETMKELKDAGVIEVIPNGQKNAICKLLDRTKSAYLSNVDNSTKTDNDRTKSAHRENGPIGRNPPPDRRISAASMNIVLKDHKKTSTTPPTPSYPDRVDVDNPASKNGGNTYLKLRFHHQPDTCMLNRLRHYRWKLRNIDGKWTWFFPITPANLDILAGVKDTYKVDTEKVAGCPSPSL